MKKYSLGIIAVVIAIAGAAFASPGSKEIKKNKTADGLNIYYYRFDGDPGDEDVMSEWTQLVDEPAYDLVNCEPGNDVGCKIQNTTNSSGHPTSVPLSGGVPQQTGVNVAVENRD